VIRIYGAGLGVRTDGKPDCPAPTHVIDAVLRVIFGHQKETMSPEAAVRDECGDATERPIGVNRCGFRPGLARAYPSSVICREGR